MAARDLDDLVVPAARDLPSPSQYLAHMDVLDANRSLVRLASNENTQPPSPRVREALERAYDSANLYPSLMPPLRRELAERHGVEVDRVLVGAGSTELIVKAGRAGPVIVSAATAADASLVAMGSRRLEGLRAMGSVSRRVVHQARCSVLLVPPETLTR